MSLNKKYTPNSLRNEYNVGRNAWAIWIKPLVKKKKVRKHVKVYTPAEVKAIRELLGEA